MKFVLHLLLSMVLLSGGLAPAYCQRGGGFIRGGGGKGHVGKSRSQQRMGRKGKHRSYRTKQAGADISRQYNQGRRDISDIGNRVADRVQRADYQSSRNHITWHEAARAELYAPHEKPISAMYAEDIFMGKISLADLTPQEQTEFLLAEFPGLVVEGEMVPSAEVWKDVVQEYRSRLLNDPTAQQQADPISYWAEQMSLVTNVGFFGSTGDELFVMVAAMRNFPPELQPLTDVITVRSLLNLNATTALNDFVDMRLAQVDGKGRPMVLPAVWREFPWEIVKRIPNSRLEPGGEGKGILVDPHVQVTLGQYNSYNLMNLDPSYTMTSNFLNLRHGMNDKINDYAFVGQASRGQLEQVLQHRLQRSFEEAELVQDKYGWNLSEHFPSASPQWIRTLTDQGELKVENIYPYAPDYLTEDLLLEYMLTKHNMEIRKWYPIISARNVRLYNSFATLYRAAKPAMHPAAEDMAWLAGQVSKQTQYLVVGNVNVKNWEKYTLRLMQQLRRQHPDRKIILLDQYGAVDSVLWTMLDGQRKTGEDLLNIVTDVAESSILKSDMDIRRFEDPLEDGILVIQNGDGAIPFENTLEGLRITSQAYMNQVAQVRAENPDALIVLSVNHMLADYSVPYSLGGKLYGPNTFVTHLSINPMEGGQGETLFDEVISPAESANLAGVETDLHLTEDTPLLTDMRVLQFNNGVLPAQDGLPATPINRAVGFDARIFVSK